MEGNERAEHVFTSGGYFEDYSGEELVRFETVKGPNGKDFVSVSINAGHASRETLGALVHYEAIHFLWTMAASRRPPQKSLFGLGLCCSDLAAMPTSFAVIASLASFSSALSYPPTSH